MFKLALIPEDELVVSFLTYDFPAGYQGPVPSTSLANHTSVDAHPRDIATYIMRELDDGAMLDPFENPPPSPFHTMGPGKPPPHLPHKG